MTDVAAELAVGPLPTLQVSEIGEYVRFQSCARRAKLSFNRRAEARRLPFYSRLQNTLDVVLRDRGLAMEGAWERQLVDQDYVCAAQGERDAPVSLEQFLEQIAEIEVGALVFGREIVCAGQIGAFDVEGRMDFVVVMWRDGTPYLRIVEGKASRRDKTYQRMQVAAYLLLVRQAAATGRFSIAGQPLTADRVEALVARVDEDLREPQDILSPPPLDLTSCVEDVSRLLGPHGPLVSAARSDISDLPYRLEPKCDNCVFNVHCLPETGRQRRTQLLGVSQSTCRALAAQGITTIDQLADLDPANAVVGQLRADDGVDEEPLRLIAKATARRKMLPGGREHDGFAVSGLPMSGLSQCPEYNIDGRPLVRIYLNVDYDYVEDRLVSVSAYVVSSTRQIQTPFGETDAGRRPVAGAFEVEQGQADRHPLSGRKLAHFKATAWTGNPAEDSASERQILEGFFQELTEAIADVAAAEEAPLHFYVWSPSEMTRLMEACARGGASLIRHLSELLGCRPGREQLIYTSLQTEVNRRYGLGWTGRGLGVATALTWFGQRFHWVRTVRGNALELDRVFHQDIFDFASTLLTRDGAWARDGDPEATLERFELRSRFNDSLSMPYYSVVWGSLRSAAARFDTEPLVRAAVARYEAVLQQPGLLRAYLEARCEALRFLEERCSKNSRLVKPAFTINDLGSFELGVNTPRSAAVDVLRIDWQIGFNDWRAAQTLTAGERVASGRCLPLRDVNGDQDGVTATIAPEIVGLDLAALERRYANGAGSFVRLMPWSGDAAHAADLNGAFTCVIDSINWQTGQVQLSPQRPVPGAHYRLFNAPMEGRPFGLLELSATDYVAPRVEARLSTTRGGHVDAWFDLSQPTVTPAAAPDGARLRLIGEALQRWRMPERPDAGLVLEQSDAAIAGCTARIQALQGPPGTGKTATTAAAIFARSAACLQPGATVILAGPTHRAVDTTTERLDRWEASLRQTFQAAGVEPPPLRIVRLDPRPDCQLGGNIQRLAVPGRVGDTVAFHQANPEAITIYAGTVTALLKFEEKLGAGSSLNADLLVVDEASMMVFPHLLALASLTNAGAQIMLAGDNRQLSPILAHTWDREDRPPTIQFQPFLSAYEVAARVADAVGAQRNAARLVTVSRLQHTFRLAPAHRDLISAVYRLQDGLELHGRAEDPGPRAPDIGHRFAPIWQDPRGLVLVVHSEASSRKENALERAIIEEVLTACPALPERSVAVLSPHRGQRSLLQEQLRDHACVAVVDTVERLQGGEAPTVIVSATASDPSQVQNAESFLMNMNRANVAFSRAEERLIVVVSETLLDHVAADLEVYEASLLWKELRRTCSQLLVEVEINGHRVRALGCPAPLAPDLRELLG